MRGRIPEEVLQRVNEVPILDVASEYVTSLKRSGTNHFGLCPFHKEKTASFSVHPGKNIFNCFGCGEKGGVVGLVMKLNGLSFPEAVEKLARRAGISFDREWIGETKERQNYFEVYNVAAQFYQRQADRKVVDYLTGEKRGLAEETIKSWQIGYAPDGWSNLRDYLLTKGVTEKTMLDYRLILQSERGTTYDFFRERIIIPIKDRRGNIIAFAGRVFPQTDATPKFLNSAETQFFKKSRMLFGIDKAAEAIRKKGHVIVMEGYFDGIISHQAGFDNTVALAGTSFTEGHVDAISRLTNQVIFCLDPDEAGINRTISAGRMCLESGLDVLVAQMPEGKDPDEAIMIDGGKTFGEIVSSPRYLIDFRMQTMEIPEHPDEKVAALKPLFLVVDSARNPALKSLYLEHIAKTMGIDLKALRNGYIHHFQQSQKNGRKTNRINIELAVLSYLARTPTYRRNAGAVLSTEYFSDMTRQMFFTFLAQTDAVDDVLLKPDQKILDRPPLFKIATVSRLKERFIEYCSNPETGLGVAVNEDEVTALFSQLAELRVSDKECIEIFKKMTLETKIKEVEEEIRRASERADTDKINELMLSRIQLVKEMGV